MLVLHHLPDPVAALSGPTALGEDTADEGVWTGVYDLGSSFDDSGIARFDVDWGDGSPVQTFSYAAGTASFSEDHRYLDDNPSGTSLDIYTVALTLTDDDTGQGTGGTSSNSQK